MKKKLFFYFISFLSFCLFYTVALKIKVSAITNMFYTIKHNDILFNQLKTGLYSIEHLFIAVIICFIILLFLIFYLCTINRKEKNKSNKDSLTGAYNRHFLEDSLMTKSYSSDNTIILIDIDFFKNYNDYYGHCKGDLILFEISNHIQSLCSKKQYLVRYGGEEFCIICENMNQNESLIFSQSIHDKIESENIIHHKSPMKRVTLSIGISAFGNNLEYDDINNADIALYQSKNTGRNKFTHFKNIKYNTRKEIF